MTTRSALDFEMFGVSGVNSVYFLNVVVSFLSKNIQKMLLMNLIVLQSAAIEAFFFFQACNIAPGTYIFSDIKSQFRYIHFQICCIGPEKSITDQHWTPCQLSYNLCLCFREGYTLYQFSRVYHTRSLRNILVFAVILNIYSLLYILIRLTPVYVLFDQTKCY